MNLGLSSETRRGCRWGFTLIELLVVVSIILLLITIFIPVLSRVQRQAKIVVCAANLRQLCQASLLYASDNRGKLPSAAEDTGTGILTYWRWGGKNGTEYTNNVRLINAYLQRGRLVGKNDAGVSEVFHCPLDTGGVKGAWPNDRLPTIFDCFGSSYLYNSSANNNNWNGPYGLFNKTISSIKSPSRVVLACDWSFNCYFFYNASGRVFQYSYWHHPTELGWGNVVFVDGHIANLQATFDKPDFQSGEDYSFRFDQ